MKIIHVNNVVIRHNNKFNNTLPACRVQEGTKVRYCQEVIINGPSHMVYRPDKPLRCGAKLWIETDADVELVGEVEYASIRKDMESLNVY
jgi:hypothetical protein